MWVHGYDHDHDFHGHKAWWGERRYNYISILTLDYYQYVLSSISLFYDALRNLRSTVTTSYSRDHPPVNPEACTMRQPSFFWFLLSLDKNKFVADFVLKVQVLIYRLQKMTNSPVHSILQPTSNAGPSQTSLEQHPLLSDYKLFKPSTRPVTSPGESRNSLCLLAFVTHSPSTPSRRIFHSDAYRPQSSSGNVVCANSGINQRATTAPGRARGRIES